MRITQISYDGTNVHISIGAPAANKDNKFGYAYFLLLARRLPKFLADLATVDPHASLKELPAEPAPAAAPPVAPPSAPDKQVTLDEVIARQATMTITQTLAGSFDPDKVAASFAQPAEVVPPRAGTTLVTDASPFEPLNIDITTIDKSMEPPKAPEPATADAFDTAPTTEPGASVWKSFVLDVGELFAISDRKAVLPTAADIWKKHRAAVRALGKEFNGNASDHLSRIVGETLGISTAEAHTLIKAELANTPAPQVEAPKVTKTPVTPVMDVVQAGTTAPVTAVAPVEVVAPVDPKVAKFLGLLGAKTQTPQLKDILQVGCECCVEEVGGKRVVKRSALIALIDSIKGCHPLLDAANMPNIEKAINGSQMPIFAAVGNSKARWDAAA